MSPIYVTRVPTVYSLNQLEDDIPVKGVAPTPYSPVSQVPGQLLPKLSFLPAAGTTSKRVRSFGNLQAHLVPDVDEPRFVSQSFGSLLPALWLVPPKQNSGLE